MRPLFRWTPGLAAAALAFASFGAPADSPENALPAKRMVKSVEVIVTGTPVDANRIRANMATREGGPFSDETVERDIKNLYATGLVESVDISTQDVAGGVRVIVRVGGRGVIGDVTFVGNSVVDTKSLKKEIDIKVGQSVDETKLFASQNKIRELYSKKGFADVNVNYATQAMPDKKGFVRV
ncbi:MAG TPA: POTRA domain-containing protein, partial [Verrucomicrobiaceae bacterium]